ncbi:MAG: sensor histidine kinase, partial [Nonomuraea sp.]|nr:sensor histidine kinase [Nonomuraea sp.]
VLREEPGHDLAALLDEARAAGTPVEASVVEVALPTPAFRIVQEALTNARKHAPGQPVTLTITGDPSAGLTIEATNPIVNPSVGDPGVGLIGLAERAELAGGRVEHAASRGRFVLRAWLPWPV